MTIRFLDWDSSFFGLKIGQADTDSATTESLTNLKNLKSASGYDLVYWVADSQGEDPQVIKNRGLPDPADIKIIFSKNDLVPENAENIEKYNGPVSEKLIGLAIESGHNSRFRKDSRLNGRFIEMYTTWITKSVSGELADVVLVSQDQNFVNGFVTVRRNDVIGTIGLIAVDPNFRGMGIGGSLMKAASNWCIESGCGELRVATQMENTGACHLYERQGYKRLMTKLVFHI